MAEQHLIQLKSLLDQYQTNAHRAHPEYRHPPAQDAHLTAELNRTHTQLPGPQLQPAPVSTSLNTYCNHSALYTLLMLENITRADIEYIQSQKHAIPDRQRSNGLFKSHRLQEWITADESRKLLIHENLEMTSTTSWLSITCSTLFQEVIEVPTFRPIIFFCSRHLHVWDRHSGGHGMIKSLIEQMLSHERGVNTFLDVKTFQSACQGNIDALCSLFRHLAHQVPEGVNFICILDGINFYEGGPYESDMRAVLAMLLNLLQDCNMRSKFKLLVANRSRTEIIREFGTCVLDIDSTPIEHSWIPYLERLPGPSWE